jgi:ABC-type transport system involved in multi-copper enzyme maturation permease subunit
VDLYLSRPVGRVRLLLSRYAAGLLLSLANLVYLIGSIWLIVIWKTKVVHPRFLLGGGVILFAIAALLAFAFLVGVVTSSTGVSIMTTYGVFFFAVTHQWQATTVHALYWIFPKTAELGAAVVAYVSSGQGPARLQEALTWVPFATTGAFGLACLGLSSFLFRRKDF